MSRYRHADNLTGIIAMALHQYEHPLDPNKMTASEINGMPSAIVLRYQNDPKFNAWVKSIVARVLTEEDATIARLTRELEEARGMCDLYVDEFHRIIAIADNSEIKGLCERAVFGIKQRIPLIEQRDNLEAENAALRAELADLKDGLTAAHMDGFASGKAEATEMLRKREGQLEELRAEVKAYREVEDSLQKEIKRLDAEAERLKAAERIRVAGLRETRDALVEKLRAEVERLKALENKMGSGWALVEYEKMQARAEQAEKELAAEKAKVEKVREWMTESGFCSAPYCKKCVIKLEQILK